MTDTERAELKRLAEKATPGPWSTKPYGPDHVEVLLPNGFSRIISDPTVITDYDARFIAFANPAAVLGLLATLEDQRHVIAEMGRKLDIRKQWDVQAEACLEELARAVHLGHPEPIRTFPTDGSEFTHLIGAVRSNVNGRSEYKAETETLRKNLADAQADNAANAKEAARLRDLLVRAAGVLRDLAGMPIEADLLEAQAKEDT